MTRYRLGNILVWLGILTWLPFVVLRIAGEKPALFWFLSFHLAGVIGGSHLRALTRKELGMALPKQSRLRMIGHGLMFAGILVWAPYFYLKAMGQSVDAMDYLPIHLTGMFGGIALLGIDYWISRRKEAEI